MRPTPYALYSIPVLLLAAACTGSEPAPSPSPEGEAIAETEEGANAPAKARDGAVPEGTELPDPSTLPDVLLITLDTTRADRLGSYGYAKAHTDTLDALAAKGRRYERAYSPLPLTIPSHATLFTGTYPPTHGIRSNSDEVLGEDAITLAERLKAVGYRTGASVAAFVTTRRFGFSQGFDVYFDDVDIGKAHWHSERPADIVIDDILSWDAMSDPSQPRFAWVHLYDAHFPYLPRPGYLKKTNGRRYDAELAWVDDQVARLVEAFDDRPTMVVVVGDHGESLGEHNELAHGMQIYDVTQHVPFFMAGPGIEAGQVESDPVALADVAPILLDTLGLPPLEDAEGLAKRGEDAPPIYMEAYELAHRFSLAPPVAVVDGPLKYIHLPKPELYDLVADPDEKKNLAGERTDDVTRLSTALAGLGFEPPSSTPGMGGAADGSLQAQLEALGYVSGAQDFDPDAILPDPKDHRGLLQRSQQSDRLARQEKFDEQEKLLAELCEEYPYVVEFHGRLARARLRLGNIAGAEEAIEAGLKQSEDNVRLLTDKGAVLTAQGRFRDASDTFQLAAEKGGSLSPRIRTMAVTALMRAGNVAEAVELGERYLSEHPDDYNLAGILGVHYVDQGNFMQALTYLERGILADLPERSVAFHMAAVEAGKGDRAGSIELLKQEVRHYPDHLRAVSALGRLLLADGEQANVLDLVAQALQRMPKAPELFFLKAQAQFNLGRFEASRATLDEGLALQEAPPADLVMLEANLLKQEGKPDEAQTAYERALKLRQAERQRTAAKNARQQNLPAPLPAPHPAPK